MSMIEHKHSFFFLNDPPTPEIYPLPLHDALPILPAGAGRRMIPPDPVADVREQRVLRVGLDVRALRLPALEVEEPQEVLEVAGTQDEHPAGDERRSEEHTSELQSPCNLVCRLLLE